MSNAFNPSIVIYFDDLFAKIHHYLSTVIGAMVWVHIDSEVVVKDIDKKKKAVAQTKLKHNKVQTDSTVSGVHWSELLWVMTLRFPGTTHVTNEMDPK